MIYVLFSSGIDSLGCLHWALQEFGPWSVTALYVDVGQRYAEKELRAAHEITDLLGVRMVVRSELKGMLQENFITANIPLRNMFMILTAALMPDAEGVVFGMLKGEWVTDKNPKFVRRLQKMIDSQGMDYFRIYTPLANKTKRQVVRQLVKEIPDAVMHTIGCHSVLETPCGRCLACRNRWIAFYGHRNPDTYRTHPGQVMLDSLTGLRPGDLSRGPLWARRTWILEAYQALNAYCLETHKQTVLSYSYERRGR